MNIFQGCRARISSERSRDLLLMASCCSIELLTSSIALGQIVPDATLPNPSQVSIEGNQYAIDGGTQTGANLFHSMEFFSRQTFDRVSFSIRDSVSLTI